MAAPAAPGRAFRESACGRGWRDDSTMSEPDAARRVLAGPGAVVSIPDPGAADAVLSAGYGWVVIDTEHSVIDPSTQVWLTATVQGRGAAALVRVAANDHQLIGAALDGGADGVIVPGVESPDAAAAAAAAVRYPPRGTRSI